METFENDPNPFLRKVSARLLKKYFLSSPNTMSSNFLTRTALDRGNQVTDMWFKSRGCRYSLQGGCSMCNYGFDTNVNEKGMVEAVREGLDSLDWNLEFHLLVSPSGSMLDDWEVPPIVRSEIFQSVSKHPTLSFACETRAQYVNHEKVREIVDTIPDRPIRIAMGLESSSQWVLKHSINKSLSLETFENAVQIIKQNGALASTNIALGAPFLSEIQMIADTLNSIQWAYQHGIDECYVFPIGVKPGTLVEWLWQNNLYSPPSLWSMIYVLKNIPLDYLDSTTLAWHKSYYNKLRIEAVLPSVLPTTCPKCQDDVIDLLDQYIAFRDYALLDKLEKWQCSCKDIWQLRLEQTDASPISEANTAYELIGKNILGEEWWQQYGYAVINDLNSSSQFS